MKKAIDLDYLHQIGAIMRLQGKDYVLYSGLLRIAHDNGLQGIETTMLSWDPKEKAAVFKATVNGERGVYTAHGDANPSNVKGAILSAALRMAETRAVCRALRAYTGIGMTAVEEMPGDQAEEEPRPAARTQPEPANAPPKHHPSWTDAARKGFCAALGKLGLRYEDVATYLEVEGQGRPSQWTSEDRKRFFADVEAGKLPDVYRPKAA